MACEFALMAESARDKLHHQQVLSCANAMQIQFQTERMRAQALHHRKLVEAETLRVEQAARENAERATRKLAFLANMSHEIRTPMNAILGIAQLAMQTELLPKQYDYLDKIHRSGVSLLEIIDDILDLSKIEAGQLALESVPFDLDEVLEDVARLTRSLANEKQISYLFDVPCAVPRHVCGDPLRLGQILRNLVLNALQNTEQGQIRLSCSVRQSDPQQVGLWFSVEDTGAGMDAEEATDLFSPLASSVSARGAGGIPLGLWVSFHLVRLMGAAFAVQSEPGHGSCFSFEVILGRVAQVPSPDVPVVANTGTGQFHDARVLLVDDNEFNQEIGAELLAMQGIDVDIAKDGRQALDMLQIVGPDFYQLIFMDLEMPILDGHEATRILRQDERFAKLPVVAMTAHALLEMRERCLAGGMQDYITKPIDLGQLNQVLVRWLPKKNRRSDLPEVVATPPTLPMMHLPGIDIQLGLSYAAGKQDLYHSMLRRFYDTRQNFMTQMQAHLSGGERQEVLRLLHTVRGICGSIGAKALVEAVQAVESYLSGDGNTLPNNGLWHQHLAQLQTMFDQVFQGLALYFGAQMEPAAALASFEPECVDLTGEGARVRLGLLDLLQQLNAEALAYFARNQATLSAVIDAARMQELRALLDNFEFETACELLQ